MKLKLLLDEDFHFPAARALREQGHDAIHIQEIGRKGQEDIDQLTYAAKEKRCLVTFNSKDFIHLHVEYFGQKKDHWGVIVSPQIPVGASIKKLMIILENHSQESIKNQLLWL